MISFPNLNALKLFLDIKKGALAPFFIHIINYAALFLFLANLASIEESRDSM